MVDIKIETTVLAPSGYSYVARKLLLELYKLGVDVHLIERQMDRMRLDLPKEQLDIFKEMWKKESDKSVPYLRYGTPVVWSTIPDHERNMLMFVWENDALPPMWKHFIVPYDEYVTVNDFVGDMIKDVIGTAPKPIHIVPHGVDTNIFYPDKPMFKFDDNKFIFLAVGQWIKRKSFEELLRAYFLEFKGNEDVVLLLKTYGNDNSFFTMKSIENAIKRMSFDMGIKNPPHVVVIGQMFTEDGMRRLYNSANCFILPSKGEAWCLPYLQSMACGIPVIAQKYGGHLTYLNSNNSFLIEPETFALSNGEGWYAPVQGLRWAVPSIDNIRKMMRYVYEHPVECERVGKRALNDARKWTWVNAAEKLKKII